LYLSDFIKKPVLSPTGERVGKLKDVIVSSDHSYPIIKALKTLEGIDGLDVIVITRGGGSIAELSCFDSEKIAMTIAQLGLPVLSGIGHEINTTVTDLAAHTFAAPSNLSPI